MSQEKVDKYKQEKANRKEIMKKDADKRSESMRKTAKDRAKLVDLFRDKIFCADCGRKLYFHKHQMDCKDHYWYGDYECS